MTPGPPPARGYGKGLSARLSAIALALGVAAPALAVGFGPLVKEGVTGGPSKAFYLTIMNPYPEATAFVVGAVRLDSEAPEPAVRIHPARLRLPPGEHRRIIVIADGLVPGGTRNFRVCAERAVVPEGVPVHARVCSRLGARRLAAAR